VTGQERRALSSFWTSPAIDARFPEPVRDCLFNGSGKSLRCHGEKVTHVTSWPATWTVLVTSSMFVQLVRLLSGHRDCQEDESNIG
jgi:hypothetical protein